MPPLRLTLAQARAAWFERQRFIGEPARRRTLAESIGDIGWIPVPSPATPYLALFARGLIARRHDLDDRRVEASVVPGPRGASWLVPNAEAPLARAFGGADHASREARIAAATTLTARDLDGAREALRSALASPATVDEIRARLPETFLRSLGDPGRKSGLPTVAALVMRHMWVTGEVLRLPGEGRLDTATARWAIDPHPREVPTAADAVTVIAARWLAAHAPATAKAFAAAFGIAAGRANGALKTIKPIDVEIEGLEGAFLAPADFAIPGEPASVTRVLPLRDPFTDVQLAGLASSEAARLATSRAHGVLPVILAHGEAWGTWTFDSTARTVKWRAFDAAPSPELEASVAVEAARVGGFIQNELGGAPLHSAAPNGRARGAHVAPRDLAIEM